MQNLPKIIIDDIGNDYTDALGPFQFQASGNIVGYISTGLGSFPEDTWQMVDKKGVAEAMTIIAQRRRHHESVTAPYEVESLSEEPTDEPADKTTGHGQGVPAR